MTCPTLLPEFLTLDQCNELIDQATPLLTRSMVGLKKRTYSGSRICDSVKLETSSLSDDIRAMVAIATSTNLEDVEAVEVIRYREGGLFLTHHDGSHRSHTVTIFLNSGYEGGELVFNKHSTMFKNLPVGTAVTWDSDPSNTHSCEEVLEGEKWIASVWVAANTTKQPTPISEPYREKESPKTNRTPRVLKKKPLEPLHDEPCLNEEDLQF